MRELTNDPFYEQIKAYKSCIIDYCLMEADIPHQGYRSHKDAILFAMCRVMERYIDYQLKAEIDFNRDSPADMDEEPFPWRMDMGKARAERIDPASLLRTSDMKPRSAVGGEQIPYWYAFLETPHGTGYGAEDFDKINRILFPNGAEPLEVYEWTTDWSNYFEDGHEWWGAACWSVYDRSLNRYAVIMASTTD